MGQVVELSACLRWTDMARKEWRATAIAYVGRTFEFINEMKSMRGRQVEKEVEKTILGPRKGDAQPGEV